MRCNNNGAIENERFQTGARRFDVRLIALRGPGEFDPKGGEAVTVRRACESYGHRTQSDSGRPYGIMAQSMSPVVTGSPHMMLALAMACRMRRGRRCR